MLTEKWRLVVYGVSVVAVVFLITGAAALRPPEQRAAPDASNGPANPQDPPIPAPTTKLDFFRGGSQPTGNYGQILHSQNCGFCHGVESAQIFINKSWAGSMHAISARDPLTRACLAVAEQDAPFVGDMCIRCHAPRAWIMGRSTPTDGSAINASDRDSINCHFCHRMVDPFYDPGVSPIEDEQILKNITELPVSIGSASFVLDPLDRRRGKRGSPSPHTHLVSPFHNDATLCETCHDVSNPTLDRQPDDTYVGNAFDEPHPTGNKYDMFPGERTFSEWSISQYAATGVDTGGRFGGNKPVVSTCQDCHMPDTTGQAAEGAPVREDMADHGMYGGGTWIPLVVANLYPDEVDLDAIQAGVAGSQSMLERAATLELTQSGDTINARVINETGHKLPSGQPEGRLMWLNVKFLDADGQLIAERGAYDTDMAMPNRDDTKVYEMLLGIDEATAQATGLPVGPTHHVAFCNVIYKDTRIPPRGFTNEALRQVQSPVVGAVYPDGEHWDDTLYLLPVGATQAIVSLYYKTATTDFIEFLRDANFTNDAGQVLYDQWAATGKSPPVLMITGTLNLQPFATGDFNGDGLVDLADYTQFAGCLTGDGGGPPTPECAPGDLDGDDDVDLLDYGRLQDRFGG